MDPALVVENVNYMQLFLLSNLLQFTSDMQFMYDLEMKVAGNEDIVSISIKKAISDNVPVVSIKKYLIEMIADNRKVMLDLLGEKLINYLQ